MSDASNSSVGASGILDDAASVIGQIGLKRGEVEEFLGRRLRRQRWPFWHRNGK